MGGLEILETLPFLTDGAMWGVIALRRMESCSNHL